MEPVQSPGLELLHTFNRLLASPPSGTALDYLGLLQSDSDSEPCDDVFSIFSEINEDPDLLVRLMTMGQVGKSRPALSSMTLYWQRRYADAKRRLLAAVALETEGYVFTFVYYPKARTFDEQRMPHICYWHGDESATLPRRSAVVTKLLKGDNGLRIAELLFWEEGLYQFEDEVDEKMDGVTKINIRLNDSLKGKYLIPLTQRFEITVLTPTFHLSGWVLNDHRSAFWIHPNAPFFDQIPEERRNYILQYWRQCGAQRLDSRSHRQHGYISMDGKIQMVSRGDCFVIDGKIQMVVNISHRGSRTKSTYDLTRQCVTLMQLKYITSLGTIQEREALLSYAHLHAAHRLRSVVVLDETTMVTHVWQRINSKVACRALVVDVTEAHKHGASAADGAHFFCGIARGESVLELTWLARTRDTYIRQWVIKTSGLPSELFESGSDVQYHLAAYQQWIDAHGLYSRDKMVAFQQMFLNMDESYMEKLWHGSGTTTELHRDILTDDYYRLIAEIVSRNIPVIRTYPDGTRHGCVPYLQAFACDTQEWSNVVCTKVLMPTEFSICGKCCVRATECVCSEHLLKSLQAPRTFQHVVDLMLVIPTKRKWSKYTKLKIRCPVEHNISELHRSRNVVDPPYGLMSDVSHGQRNWVIQMVGLLQDEKLLSAAERVTLFVMLSDILCKYEMCNAKLKVDIHWDDAAALKNLTISQAQCILHVLPVCLMNARLFPTIWKPENRARLAGVATMCEIVQFLNVGIKVPRVDNIAVIGLVRDIFQDALGVRKNLKRRSRTNKPINAVDNSLLMQKAVTGKKNSPTKYTIHNVVEESLMDLKEWGSLRLYSCSKFEVKIQVLKHEAMNGVISQADTKKVMEQELFRTYMQMLCEGVGLDARGAFAPKETAVYKINADVIARCIRPLNGDHWKNLSLFVDMQQNPERIEYVGGEKLFRALGRVNVMRSEFLRQYGQEILSQFGVDVGESALIDEFKSLQVVRHGSIWNATSAILVSQHDTASRIRKNRFLYIDRLIQVKANDNVFQIALCRIARLEPWTEWEFGICGSETGFVERAVRAQVTSQIAAIPIASIKSRLICWRECTSDCVYSLYNETRHAQDCDPDHLLVASWLGKGIVPLFMPILTEHRRRLLIDV